MREKDLSRHLETNNHKAQKQEKNKKAQEMLQKDNQLRLALQLVKQLPNLKLIK